MKSIVREKSLSEIMDLGEEFYHSRQFAILSNVEISKHENAEKLVSIIQEISNSCATVDMIVIVGNFIDE